MKKRIAIFGAIISLISLLTGAVLMQQSGGGIFGFAKNPNEIGQETAPEKPNTDAATNPTNSGYWTDSGNYNTNWSGSGTEADPYLITSEQQLAGLSYMVYSGKGPSESASYNKNFYINTYFKQTKNLDMSAYYWQPIGICYERSGTQTERYFSGIYEGDGYTISGVFTEAGTTKAYSYQGLFGYTYDATIKNVGVIDSYIQGYQCIGGLVGESYSNTTITNCYNTSEVKGSGNNVGGLVGQAYLNITITNCYNTGTVNGNVYIGGLVGDANFITITNCYNTGRVSAGNNTGGLIGSAYSDTVSNCYNVGSVSGSDNINIGGLIGYGSSNKMSNCYYGGNCTLTKEFGNGSTQGNKITNLNTTSYAKNKTWYTTASNWNADYPWDFDTVWTIDESKNDGYPIFMELHIKTWEDYASDNYYSGSGTEANPYIIKTPAELAKLCVDSRSSNLFGNYYKLGASIDLSEHVWSGIGNPIFFEGNFDGGFYTIKNITTSVDNYVQETAGLFNNAGGQAKIQNIYLKNGFVKSRGFAGGILGNGSASISNCIVDGVNIEGEATVGGVAGVCTKIKSCVYRNGDIKATGNNEGEKKAGGIVGWANGRIEDCSVINATIEAVTYKGIIIAQTYTTTVLISCYGQGTVNGTATKVMYGDSSAWSNWTYSPNLNACYPVQKTLFHIGGISGSTEVYNYLRNTLGFVAG